MCSPCRTRSPGRPWARYFWRRKSASGLKKCVTYFEQALAADPAYSHAAAGLADSYTALGYYNFLPPRAAFPQAKAAADWALYFDRRYAAAASQCQRTLELDPRYVLAHTVLGQVHAATSRYDAAIDAFQSAVNVSGGLPFAVAALGYAYARAGEGREAAAVLEKLRQRTAAEDVPPVCVALVHTGLGHVDQAL